MRPIHIVLSTVACAALLLAACEEPDQTTEDVRPEEPDDLAEPPAGGDAEVPPPDGATDVPIRDFAFQPEEVEVAVGGGVTWTNMDEVAHTVDFEDGEASGELQHLAEYTRTFDEPGEYAYQCALHPNMQGTVTVTE